MALTLMEYKAVRQKCRSSLLYLCGILGYTDVCRAVHGPLLDSLQKFQGGEEEMKLLGGGKFGLVPESYKPAVSMWALTGPRKTLVLIPRGHLKSSVATMAHTIQWIINYPNIRILLSSGTGDQVRKFMQEIKSHFQYNEKFRYYFPEFCPHGKGVKEFGNQEQFTVPARTIHRKEPTVSSCSVGAVVAGGHFDVVKNDDIVDKENVRTPEQIMTVKSHYGFLWPLVETSDIAPFKGWMDLVGTRYDFCLIGSTPILMADWSHKLIENVKAGDIVVGWIKENGKRYLRPSKVTACGKYEAKAVNRYVFESGRSVTSTPEHKWWKGPWNSGDEYKTIGLDYLKMKHVRRLIIPTTSLDSREAGWLAGIYDGEGTIQVNKPPYNSAVITICQSMHNPDLIDRIRQSLTALGFNFIESWHSPSKAKGGQKHWKDRCVFKLTGGWRERYRFLVEIAPFRSSRIVKSLFSQLMTEEDKLKAIEKEANQDVYWFQCETGNYIANGYCSKNSDLYGSVIDGEKENPQGWNILEQDAIVEGELSMEPCTADCGTKGPHPIITHCKSLWPSRVPPQALLDILNDPLQGPGILASQYRMNPIPDKSGLIERDDELVWIPRKDLDGLLARLTQRVTIDLAGMEPSTNKLADNDFTVINHHGFGRDGRLYINRIWRGRYTPHEVIEILFRVSRLYPTVLEFKISKDHFARVLLPFLRREMAKRNIWLPITEVPIDNRVSKQQKIKGLQPWFKMKSIVIAADIDCKLAFINEVMRFPKFSHDDILDTICDALQGRDGVNPDVTGRPKTVEEVREQQSPLPEALTWAILQGQQTEQETQYDLITGW